MSKPILGYWNIRGTGQSIRLLLGYLEVDFIDRRYSLEENGKEWFDEKFTLGLAFPNIPYYIDGDLKLTQSLAILRYLARKYQLSSASTESERILADLVEQQLFDYHEAFYRLLNNANYEQLRPKYLEELRENLTKLTDWLGENDFCTGQAVSYVDFYFYEYLIRMRAYAPEMFSSHQRLNDFIDRIETLPAVKQYMAKQTPTPFVPSNVFGFQHWNANY